MAVNINKEGLGDRFTNPEYKPQITESGTFQTNRSQKIPLPIRFTKDIIEYIEHPDFLNMTLRPKQKEFIKDFYSTDALGYPLYDEGVFIAGMRGGKTILAALCGTFQAQLLLAMDNPAVELHQMSGQRIALQFISSSEVASRETCYAAVESILQYNPYWQKYIDYLKRREDAEGLGKGALFEQKQGSIEFHEKNIVFFSLHSNSSSLAGKTSIFCAYDEICRFDTIDTATQGKTQKRTADAVYDTVTRSAKTLKGIAKVISISSPMFENDFGMKLLLMSGKCVIGSQAPMINALRTKVQVKVPRLLGYHCTTMELNPDLTEEDFASDRARNPEAYRRDYLGIPPASLSPFFEYPERIEKCVRAVEDPLVLFEDTFIEEGVTTDDGYVSRIYVGKKCYPVKQDLNTKFYISCDQGESKDNFVLTMAHLEELSNVSKDLQGRDTKKQSYKIVVDLVEGWVPDKENRVTVSFSNVEENIKTLGDQFNIVKVTYDQWNSVESLQRLFALGFYTEKLGATMDMYDELKHLLYSGQVSLPRHERMLTEIRQLNKIKGKYVDHSSGSSKDYADAVCRVVYCIYEDYIKGAIDGDQMMGQTTEFPTIRSLDQAREVVNNSYAQPIDSPIWGLSGADDVFGKGTVVRTNVMANIKQKK